MSLSRVDQADQLPADFSEGDDGTWVRAWVWVYYPGEEG